MNKKVNTPYLWIHFTIIVVMSLKGEISQVTKIFFNGHKAGPQHTDSSSSTEAAWMTLPGNNRGILWLAVGPVTSRVPGTGMHERDWAEPAAKQLQHLLLSFWMFRFTTHDIFFNICVEWIIFTLACAVSGNKNVLSMEYFFYIYIFCLSK